MNEEYEDSSDAAPETLPTESDPCNNEGSSLDCNSADTVKPYPLPGYRLRKHACLVCTWLVMVSHPAF